LRRYSEVVFDAMNAAGCELFVDLPKAAGVGHSTMVLIDRGDCYFVEKAWHAQLAGASAVIVAAGAYTRALLSST
jgi:hypothetical protein